MRHKSYETARASLIGNRGKNEDRGLIAESFEAVLLILADGMGGHPKGDVAAQLLASTCENAFSRVRKPIPDPQSFLCDILQQSHRRIMEYGETLTLGDYPRTTGVVALIQQNTAYWAYAGDSRLYLIREGRILMQTQDHSYAELLHKQGTLRSREKGAPTFRNYVTNCLGGAQTPANIASGPATALEIGDILLLCSDGLWGQVSDEDMIKSLSDPRPLGESLDSLTRRAVTACEESDNVTAVAMRVLERSREPLYKATLCSSDRTPGEDHENDVEKSLTDLIKALERFERSG